MATTMALYHRCLSKVLSSTRTPGTNALLMAQAMSVKALFCLLLPSHVGAALIFYNFGTVTTSHAPECES